MRIGIVVGEQSGDNLGAGLMRAILKTHPDCIFEGIGGPEMQKLGLQSMFPMERLSVMGFIEPLGRLPELLRIERSLIQHFTLNPPDIFIGIDSPAFNLRIERVLRQQNIKTAHYVSPSVWAYAEKRIERIAQAVDIMLVLLPFETSIYQAYDIPVKFVGHPLADRIDQTVIGDDIREEFKLGSQDTAIALLPGSRGNEIKRIAPVFLQTARDAMRKFPQLKFLLPCANQHRYKQLEMLIKKYDCESIVKLIDGQAHKVIAASDFVFITSGTATLEALLLRKPMVICYKLAPLTYFFASRMLKVPYVGLPNLLAGRLLVPEYLQDQVTVKNLSAELDRFMTGHWEQGTLVSEFESIHRQLAVDADNRAAKAILELLN